MTRTEVCQEDLQKKLLLKPREAALVLNVSERTLFAYEKAGKIKPLWLSRQVKRYSWAAIDAFIASSPAERSDG